MTDAQRNLITAGLICGAAASIVTGIAVRERVDLGLQSGGLAHVAGATLIASRSVETDISVTQYFEQLQLLLKREFVEPIRDDLKLANGAVRGMVNSLADERCVYLDEAAMRVYENLLKGRYEGIGADLVLERTKSATEFGASAINGAEDSGAQPSRIPRLVVASVVPGGPAARAGVKPGDWVESVDGKWVVNAEVVDRIRMTQEKVRSREWPESKLDELREELRVRAKSSTSPYRAMEKLSQGSGSTVDVTWRRGGELVRTTIEKRSSSRQALAPGDKGALRLRFYRGVEVPLREALKGKATATLDLRGASFSDPEAMRECLAVVAPAGDYGLIEGGGGKSKSRLKVASGASKAVKLTLIVDRFTRGAAEVFARALRARGFATVSGELGNDASIVELRKLPAKNGYTLVTGLFKATSNQGGER